MIQNILIPVEVSSGSEAAIELGLRWARRTGAAVTGLGIVDEPTIGKPDPCASGAGKIYRQQELIADARVRVNRLLDKFAKQCHGAAVRFATRKEVGVPSERIIAAAEDFDLTLLGHRSNFHFETQTHPDETLEEVLRDSRRPVAAVADILPVNQTVVVAYDGSPTSVRALETFQKSNLDVWQKVRVVSVGRDEVEARRHAEEGARFLRFFDIPAEPRALVASENVANLLIREVHDLDAGMLVMGAFGRSQAAESLFGSTTLRVLETADTLLFLHH
jgi:nucleotide-binding universal stress UspA family protein